VQQYRRAAHTIYALHYHFVFITKYRKPVLRGEIGKEVRDLIREICRTQDIEILQGHVRPDHIHLLLSVPPHLAPSRVMQAIKGKTASARPEPRAQSLEAALDSGLQALGSGGSRTRDARGRFRHHSPKLPGCLSTYRTVTADEWHQNRGVSAS